MKFTGKSSHVQCLWWVEGSTSEYRKKLNCDITAKKVLAYHMWSSLTWMGLRNCSKCSKWTKIIPLPLPYHCIDQPLKIHYPKRLVWQGPKGTLQQKATLKKGLWLELSTNIPASWKINVQSWKHSTVFTTWHERNVLYLDSSIDYTDVYIFIELTELYI